ncbi:MAG: hypothetical protein EOO46_25370, partial [Flavobacterium sp.]
AGGNTANKKEPEISLQEKTRIDRAWKSISELKRYIHTGDLVTRTGNDFTSESLRSLNQRNKTYSHCGIASIENDTLFVYHALGGEFNPDQKIRRDRWEEFAEPYSNRGVGVFRFSSLSFPLKTLLDSIQSYIDREVTFDMDFDLATDNKMYCAEFVAKSYSAGSGGALKFPVSSIKSFKFFGVDDLFLHPSCDSITSTVYK